MDEHNVNHPAEGLTGTAGTAGTPGTPGSPGSAGGVGGVGGPGGPGGEPSGTGGPGGVGGVGGVGGLGGGLRGGRLLFAAAGAVMLFAILAFAVAILQNRATAIEAKATATALKAEIHRHCIFDADQQDQQRRLDLSLAGTDRRYLAALAFELPHATDRHDRALITSEQTYIEGVLDARIVDLPAYTSPAAC